MKLRITRLVKQLRSSYWFVPTLMVVSATALAWVLGGVDRTLVASGAWPEWFPMPGPETARAVLSTVAGSMITVAGVTFSVIMVAFSLAASQLGPRILANFMRDTGNQVTLGTFVATFVYCLVVLREIRGPGGGASYVPPAATAGALAMTVASLGVLIYFFQHAADLIQAGHAVATAGDQLEHAVEEAFPERPEGAAEDREGPDDDEPAPEDEGFAEAETDAVESPGTGYLSSVDRDGLFELAVERNLALRAELVAGDFVVQGAALARVRPAGALDDDGRREVAGAFVLVRRRGTSDDVQLAVDRLVEIALRALSPGINDPFTALACIDRLGSGLALAASRHHPRRRFRDDDGTVRLVLPAVTFGDLIDDAFTPVRRFGRDSLAVLLRLMEAAALIGSRSGEPALHATLARHARSIRDEGCAALGQEWERERLERAWAAAQRVLEA